MMYVQSFSCQHCIHFELYLTSDRPSEPTGLTPHLRWTSSRTIPMTP